MSISISINHDYVVGLIRKLLENVDATIMNNYHVSIEKLKKKSHCCFPTTLPQAMLNFHAYIRCM